MLEAGDAFGELALLTGQPRAASVITPVAASSWMGIRNGTS